MYGGAVSVEGALAGVLGGQEWEARAATVLPTARPTLRLWGCTAVFPCGYLTCSPFTFRSKTDLKCYNYPRIVGEPCIPGAGDDSLEKCGPGLVCRPDTKKCDTPR